MKKINTWMMMIIMILTTGMMTSCDRDEKLSFKLEGEWRGDFGMNYTIERSGRTYTFDSFDTYLVFYSDYPFATHGWGKQVDYYDYGPYEYQYYRFNWRIRDGVIYITYPRNPELEVTIYDYKMSYSHFTGWFGNSDICFDLRKLSDDYDWDFYTDDYSFNYRVGWSYSSFTRSTTDSADNKEIKETSKENEEFRVVGIGNRYMNNLDKEEE